MYYEWLENYSSEQLQPQFPFLWMAKLYAWYDSKRNPECIAQVFDSARKDYEGDDLLIVAYQNGKEYYEGGDHGRA